MILPTSAHVRSLLLAVLTGAALSLAPGLLGADAIPTQAHVDLRPEFASHGIAVRQQGQRGACQVFAMVGTIEFLLAKAGRPADLSEQFLMWAANQENGLDRTEGFNPDLLIKGLRQYGICAESLMAYVPRNEPLGEPREAAIHDARPRASIEVDTIQHWTAPIGFGDEVLKAIIDRLDRGIPVTVTLCWPFGLTDEEIVDSGNFLIDRAIDGNDKSGHGVVLVGMCAIRLYPAAATSCCGIPGAKALRTRAMPRSASPCPGSMGSTPMSFQSRKRSSFPQVEHR